MPSDHRSRRDIFFDKLFDKVMGERAAHHNAQRAQASDPDVRIGHRVIGMVLQELAFLKGVFEAEDRRQSQEEEERYRAERAAADKHFKREKGDGAP